MVTPLRIIVLTEKSERNGEYCNWDFGVISGITAQYDYFINLYFYVMDVDENNHIHTTVKIRALNQQEVINVELVHLLEK